MRALNNPFVSYSFASPSPSSLISPLLYPLSPLSLSPSLPLSPLSPLLLPSFITLSSTSNGRMVYNEKLREIRIGLTTIVAAKWIITRKIGEGAFGMVFECTCIAKPSVKRALKAELTGIENESLKMEIYVMRKMMSVNAAHSVQLFGAGTMRNINYVVMTLLGLSLSDIRKRLPDEKFSLDTLIVVGIQATDSLRELHSAGFVHRDIKPSNYTVGKEQSDWIYLIDFGICREIMYTEDLLTKLKCPRRSCQFRGTTRYCSINAHKRKELGRHDDLISMMYMLFEGHAGSLPWKHKDRVTTEKLKSEKEEEMLAAAPKPFVRIFEYLRDLTYFHSPDYKKVRNEFVAMTADRKLTPPYKLDWDEMVVPAFEKANPSSAMNRKTLDRDKLLNEPDTATLYEIPDEFPVEESCSDSDQTIPSEQEKKPTPTIFKTEEKTQSEEQGSMMQCVKTKTDVPKTKKDEKGSNKDEEKKEKKEEKKEERKEGKKEKEKEKKEEKKEERKEEKREEKPKKAKDESSKLKGKKEKDKDGSPIVKVEKAVDMPTRTPLPTAPTPAATTPATAATAATPAATHAPATKPKKAAVKEVHVEALTPLRKTECSVRRKERSEMRKKRREARGGKSPMARPKAKEVKTPLKSAKKSEIPLSAESLKKTTPSRGRRTMSMEDVRAQKDLPLSRPGPPQKPNLSTEMTCADEGDDVRIPGEMDVKPKKKKKKGANKSQEDASEARFAKANEEETQLSRPQHTSPGQNLSREAISSVMQGPPKSRQRTERTLSSRRETGKVAANKTTKGTKRVVHGGTGSKEGGHGSKEARPKPEDSKPKNPRSRAVRSRNSKMHNRKTDNNLSAEDVTMEASEQRVKKEKTGVSNLLSKLVRNPGSISKIGRKKPQGPPSDGANKK